MIFWAVPKGHMPWRAVWPGAAFVTIAAGLANWLFPIYLSNVSSLSRFGSTLGFILIALLWFYVLSLALMAGAVINSLRHELHDTGELPYRSQAALRGLRRDSADRGPARPRPLTQNKNCHILCRQGRDSPLRTESLPTRARGTRLELKQSL